MSEHKYILMRKNKITRIKDTNVEQFYSKANQIIANVIIV